MKIHMIADYFLPNIGGLENSTVYLARALSKKYEVEILTIVQADSGVPEPEGVTVRRFKPDPESPYRGIMTYLDSDAPQAVCFFGISDSHTDDWLVLVTYVKTTFNAIVTLKIPSLNEFSCYITNKERKERLMSADYLICPNEAIRKELMDSGIPLKKTISRPNGISCSRFYPATSDARQRLRKAYGMGDEPVFIFTGRFAARKRVDFLVKAFSRVPEVTLLLVGYFDDRFDPGASFENLQEGNIHMAGPTYDVLPYLQASDVFVSASVAEGMPNAMLEAMACGLPALVSAIPGHLEVVQSGMNGETFVPDNLEDLMQKIRFFIRHRNRLPAYSEAARKTMLQKFSIEAVAEAYQGILSGGCS